MENLTKFSKMALMQHLWYEIVSSMLWYIQSWLLVFKQAIHCFRYWQRVPHAFPPFALFWKTIFGEGPHEKLLKVPFLPIYANFEWGARQKHAILVKTFKNCLGLLILACFLKSLPAAAQKLWPKQGVSSALVELERKKNLLSLKKANKISKIFQKSPPRSSRKS